MRILQKNPRTLRPNKFIATRDLTRQDIASLQTDRTLIHYLTLQQYP